MLLKTKQQLNGYIKSAANLIKRNIPATISLVLTITAIMLTVVCSAHTVTIFDGATSYTTSGISSDIPAALAKISLPNKNPPLEVDSFINMLSRFRTPTAPGAYSRPCPPECSAGYCASTGEATPPAPRKSAPESRGVPLEMWCPAGSRPPAFP